MDNAQRLTDYWKTHRQPILYALLAVVVLILPLIVNRLPVNLTTFPESWNIHLRVPLDNFESWAVANRATHPLFTWFFDPISDAIDFGIRRLEDFLLWLPWPVIILMVFLLGQAADGLRVALLGTAGMLFMGIIGLWEQSMQTFALMGVAVFIALLMGIPLGVLAARFDKFDAFLRPILDAMQTMPAFVYLIPVLLFFGIARVPSVVATIIYALPPAIRLTNLGIRSVSPPAVEAARAFGSTPGQILFKVQLPLAMPTIMTGVNQTIMMALGIVVIAALIGAGGLGREVLIALQRLKVGHGLQAGMAIVFMAIILDRISHGFSRQDTTHADKEAEGFRLFPNSWDKIGLVRGIEAGLDEVAEVLSRLAEMIARGLASVTKAVARLWPRPVEREKIDRFFAGHAYFFASVLTLLALVIIDQWVFAFGGFPKAWQVDMSAPVDAAVRWSRDNLYQIGSTPFGTGPFSDFLVIYGLNPLRDFFTVWLAWPLVIAAFALLAWAVSGRELAVWSAVGLVFMGMLGLWSHSIDTFTQVIVAAILTIILAIPVGVLASRSDVFEAFLRPVLDTLQTIPFFIYLVPVIMLFNVGRVPGIMASVLYALPPGIRLTNLGIRQVSKEAVEAARAFGSTPGQILWKVQLPLALPAIAAGVNQIVMMVLAMVVVAGLVGGGGLGLEAVIGLAKNQTGRGIEAGIAIVIIAMIMDRLTQAWAKNQQVIIDRD